MAGVNFYELYFKIFELHNYACSNGVRLRLVEVDVKADKLVLQMFSQGLLYTRC